MLFRSTSPCTTRGWRHVTEGLRTSSSSAGRSEVSDEPFPTECGFRLGTPGSPVAASKERRHRHRGRVVVFHGGGCRHIPGRRGPSIPLRTFGCRELREEPRRSSGSTPIGRWRAVEPVSRDVEDRGEWSAHRPSVTERLEALSGNRRRADADRLPAQRGRRRTGRIVAGAVHRRHRCGRALARRQLAPCDRGSPWRRIDHPVHDGAAFSRCGGGAKRLSCASGSDSGCHPGFAISRELIEAGHAGDVEIAIEADISGATPLLREDAYVDAAREPPSA